MARIDATHPRVFHTGDNRHEPVKLISHALEPYIARTDEQKKAEEQHPLKRAPRTGQLYNSAKTRFQAAGRRVPRRGKK